MGRLISPANFLVGHRKLGLPVLGADPDPDFLPGEIPSETVLKLLKNRERVLDSFWKLWHEDYLNILRMRSQNIHRHPRIIAKSSPWIGELVLIHDPDMSRGAWRLGRILSLKTDGTEVKSAEVKVSTGRVIRRPINLLYPLEIPNVVGDAEVESKRDTVDKAASVRSIEPSATPDDNSHSGRSLRKTAIKCRERIGDLIKDQALAGLISVPRECPGLYQPGEEGRRVSK